MITPESTFGTPLLARHVLAVIASALLLLVAALPPFAADWIDIGTTWLMVRRPALVLGSMMLGLALRRRWRRWGVGLAAVGILIALLPGSRTPQGVVWELTIPIFVLGLLMLLLIASRTQWKQEMRLSAALITISGSVYAAWLFWNTALQYPTDIDFDPGFPYYVYWAGLALSVVTGAANLASEEHRIDDC